MTSTRPSTYLPGFPFFCYGNYQRRRTRATRVTPGPGSGTAAIRPSSTRATAFFRNEGIARRRDLRDPRSGRPRGSADITDGTSNTIAHGEHAVGLLSDQDRTGQRAGPGRLAGTVIRCSLRFTLSILSGRSRTYTETALPKPTSALRRAIIPAAPTSPWPTARSASSATKSTRGDGPRDGHASGRDHGLQRPVPADKRCSFSRLSGAHDAGRCRASRWQLLSPRRCFVALDAER